MSDAQVKNLTRQLAEMHARAKAHKKALGKSKPQGRVNTGEVLERSTSAPAAKAFDTATSFKEGRSNKFKDGITVTAVDHLEYVAVPADDSIGAVCNEIYLNPSELGGTRLEKYAALYEKYLFDIIDVEYLPAVSSATKGALIIAYDRDISDDTPPPTEQGVRMFSAMEGSRDGNVWSKHEIRCKLLAPDAGYYTNPVAGGDDRLSYQGQIYVATTVPSELAEGTTLGRLRIKYRCHFYTPQLESLPAAAHGAAQYGFDAGVPVNFGTNADFNSTLINFANGIYQGYQKWKPVIDAAGKFFVPLAQGTYRITQSLSTASPLDPDITADGPANDMQMDIPTLVPNEPMPSTAPQPWIQSMQRTYADLNTGDVFGGIAGDFIVGVPRGGAKYYSTWDMGNSFTAAVDSTMEFNQVINKLSGYTPDFASGFLFEEGYRGVKECAEPKLYRAEARARSNKLRLRAKLPKPTRDVFPQRLPPKPGMLPVQLEAEIQKAQQRKLARGSDCPPGAVLNSQERAVNGGKLYKETDAQTVGVAVTMTQEQQAAFANWTLAQRAKSAQA